MATEYKKHDDANHYSICCQVVGYEWSASHKQVSTTVLKVLEGNLFNLSVTLSYFLLQENTKLPWIGVIVGLSLMMNLEHTAKPVNLST